MGLKKIQNTIGRKIKALRIEHDLTQDELAFDIKISRDHLSNIENGKHPINIKILYKFSKYFNVDMKDFF